MSSQAQEQMSEYQRFRLQKQLNNHDDDNFSAHFSNISANVSMMAKSQRQIRVNSFRSNHQNQEDYNKIQVGSKNQKLKQMTRKYLEMEDKYNQLMRMYKSKQEEMEKYKKLYNQEMNRQRETKEKLKNWVKEAKTNLDR